MKTSSLAFLMALLGAVPAAHAGGKRVLVFQLDGSVPNDTGLDGSALVFQALEFEPATGALNGLFDLSNGLKVKIGTLNPGCN